MTAREHAPRPGTRWETALRTTGEVVIADGPLVPEPRPNRSTRRAAQRKERRR